MTENTITIEVKKDRLLVTVAVREDDRRPYSFQLTHSQAAGFSRELRKYLGVSISDVRTNSGEVVRISATGVRLDLDVFEPPTDHTPLGGVSGVSWDLPIPVAMQLLKDLN